MIPELAADLVALAWQIEFGADEAIGETPVDRFAEGAVAPPRPAAPPAPDLGAEAPAAEGTVARAAACPDLAALRAAMDAFDGCALKRGAKNLVSL